jgi:hypothetical protein
MRMLAKTMGSAERSIRSKARKQSSNLPRIAP